MSEVDMKYVDAVYKMCSNNITDAELDVLRTIADDPETVVGCVFWYKSFADDLGGVDRLFDTIELMRDVFEHLTLDQVKEYLKPHMF